MPKDVEWAWGMKQGSGVDWARRFRRSCTLRTALGNTLWLSAGLWVVLGLGSAIGARTESPTEAMKGTIADVITILDDEALSKPEQAQERRRRLEHVVGARFDYEEMSKRSLGKRWNTLSDSERQEFVRLFTALLAKSYADKIDGYSGEQIEYLNERTKGNYAEVKTKVISGKVEIPLDYRMLKRSNQWWVYDVVVDGVSLVRNYRGQFTKIIKSSSYDDLVQALREKTGLGAAP